MNIIWQLPKKNFKPSFNQSDEKLWNSWKFLQWTLLWALIDLENTGTGWKKRTGSVTLSTCCLITDDSMCLADRMFRSEREMSATSAVPSDLKSMLASFKPCSLHIHYCTQCCLWTQQAAGHRPTWSAETQLVRRKKKQDMSASALKDTFLAKTGCKLWDATETSRPSCGIIERLSQNIWNNLHLF